MNDIYDVYPFNVADAVMGDKIPNVYLQGIRLAISTLTEREETVIKLRFKDKLTLEKAGKQTGTTRERIRQIEAKALSKMRHPDRQRMMLAVPLAEVDEVKTKYTALKEQYELLVKAVELISGKATTPESVEKIAEAAVWMQTNIENLDFSVRTYNCLRRAGKDTLKDLVEMTEEELRGIRNLGRKSVDEVVYTLEQHGLTLKGRSNEI